MLRKTQPCLMLVVDVCAGEVVTQAVRRALRLATGQGGAVECLAESASALCCAVDSNFYNLCGCCMGPTPAGRHASPEVTQHFCRLHLTCCP